MYRIFSIVTVLKNKVRLIRTIEYSEEWWLIIIFGGSTLVIASFYHPEQLMIL